MTRAKSELLMSWRQTVQVFSSEGCRNVDRPRSRFLDVLVPKKPQDSSTQSSATPKQRIYNQKYNSLKDKASQIKSWSASSNVRQVGTLSETKFAGTASVYGSNSNKSMDMKVKTLSTSTATLRRPLAPSNVRQVGTLAETKFAGTASVNGTGSDSNKSIDMKVKALSTSTATPRRPLAPIEARSTIPPTTMKVARSVQSQNTTDQSIQSSASSLTNGVNASNMKSNEVERNPQSMDSSWFFPIGSKVRHKSASPSSR